MNQNKANHPLEGDLLAYLDGELSEQQKSEIERHLEQCWPCRVKIGEIEESIAAFIALRQEQLPEALPPLDLAFRKFKLRVAARDRQMQRRSSFLRWIGGHVFGSLPGKRVVFGTAVALALTLAMILSPFILQVRNRPVSAQEVLQQALAAEGRVLVTESRTEAIVHHVFQIESKTVGDDSSLQMSTLETWQDGARGTYARYLRDPKGGIIFAEWLRPDGLKVSYRNPSIPSSLRLPLNLLPQTPIDYLRWLASRQGKLHIERQQLSDGNWGYEVRGEILPAVAGDRITARVLVAANDFSILEEAFLIVSRQKLKAYRLFAIKLEALEASKVDPAVFRPEKLLVADLGKRQDVRPASGGAKVAELPRLEGKLSIDPDLEVEVRHALHRAKACLGEEIELLPHPKLSGKVLARIIVDSEGRKAKLLEELAELDENPRVEIELKTRSELASASMAGILGEPNLGPVPSGVGIQVRGGKIPLHDQLYAYFSRQVRCELSSSNPQFLHDVIEARTNHFASQMLKLSQDVLLHAWALKRLAEAFPQDRKLRLSQSASERLEAMLRDHALTIEGSAKKLRAQLQLVLWPQASSEELEKLVHPHTTDDGIGNGGLTEISQRLFALAIESNASIQLHFAARAEDVQLDVSSGERVLASLLEAELLAGQITKPGS